LVQHASAIHNLNWLRTNLTQSPDDKAFCKEWAKDLLDKIAERRVVFQSEYNNQFINRHIYGEALKNCSEVSLLADAFRSAIH